MHVIWECQANVNKSLVDIRLTFLRTLAKCDMYVNVCVCVCVCERERERESECVCVCVYVCVCV